MDLSNFDLRSRTAVLELKNPLNGEVIRHDDGRPFSITLRSRDHADVVKTTDAMLSDVMRGLKAARGAAAIRDDVIKVLVTATVKWDIIVNGECPECTPQNATDLYRSQAWVREQADLFVGDRANFFQEENSDA